MSVPRHDTIRGKLFYNGREYRVLNAPLPDEFIKRYHALEPARRQVPSTAPWNKHKLKWVLKNDGLYLREMYRSDLLPYMFGKHELKADWVDHLDIHIATEVPLSSGECLFEDEKLHFLRLQFEQAKFRSRSKMCSTDYGIQMRIYHLSRQTGIYTCESSLLDFNQDIIRLKSTMHQKDLFENNINEMLESAGKSRKQFIEHLKMIQSQSKRLLYYCEEVSLDSTHNIEHIAEEATAQIMTVTGGSYSSFIVHLANGKASLPLTSGIQAFKKQLEMMLESKDKQFFDFSQPYDRVTDADTHTPATIIVWIVVGYDTVIACQD